MQLKNYTRTALCAALTAVCSQIIIPLPFTPIPFSLGVMAVMLCGGILPPTQALFSQLVYLLMGVVGIPVFSGFSAGPAKLFGPTGGFLIAYPVMAVVIALVIHTKKSPGFLFCVLSMSAGLLICYVMGSGWLMLSTGVTVGQALSSAVVPFVLPDLVKAGLAAVLAVRLRVSLGKLSAVGS